MPLPLEHGPFRSHHLPEPISSKSTNSCEIYEPAEPICANPQPARAPNAIAQRPPSVEALLARHDAQANQHSECRAEAVAVSVAAAHAAVSLIKLALAAPTEVGVPIMAGTFIADSLALGAAAASYVACKDEQAKPAQ